MKSFKKIFILLLAASIGFVACQKDNTLHYGDITMGNVIDGKFISDQGITFNIQEQTCSGILDTLKRAIVTCDILSKTGQNEYNIRLNAFSNVLTKAPVDSLSVNDSTILVEDPIGVGKMWYAGGYLNMQIAIPFKPSSGIAHMVNLVLNNDQSSNDTYRFTLKHNAFGEVMTENDMDFVIGQTYVSFPIANIIDGNKAKIQVGWKSTNTMDLKIENNLVEYNWERAGYDHTTKAMTSPFTR